MEPSEGPLRNFLMNQLYRRMGAPGTLSGCGGASMRFHLRAGGTCEVEGDLPYELPDRTVLGYNSDILFSLESGKRIAVDLKFISSACDQFKARSFTALHVKKNYGNNVYCVLAYVHMAGTGLSTEIAKSYCYPFDEFIGIDCKKPDDLSTGILNIAARLETIVERMRIPQTAFTGN
jgi:hypothetical protein